MYHRGWNDWLPPRRQSAPAASRTNFAQATSLDPPLLGRGLAVLLPRDHSDRASEGADDGDTHSDARIRFQDKPRLQDPVRALAELERKVGGHSIDPGCGVG